MSEPSGLKRLAIYAVLAGPEEIFENLVTKMPKMPNQKFDLKNLSKLLSIK